MKKFGFTLSEVLIALVIIGVLAAMLIPQTMSNTNQVEYKTAYKKALSVLNQALARQFALERMTAQDYESSESLVSEVFKKRMNVVETPPNTSVAGCASESEESYFVTTDGMIFCVGNFWSDMSSEPGSKCDFQNQTPCVLDDGANIWIDVNGQKKPNKLTISDMPLRDVFPAVIYSQKVLPYGDVAEAILYEGKPTGNQQPPVEESPEGSTPPSNSDEPDVDWDSEGPDEDNPYYDKYDPNEWPSWLDFLKWLLDWLKGLIT